MASIVLIAIAPFALCAVTGLCWSHSRCPLMIFCWLVTITGLLAARQIRELSRRYGLSISREFIIYREPFKTRLIMMSELLSIKAGPDNNLVFKTLHNTYMLPLSFLTDSTERARIKKKLEQLAPAACHVDLSTLAAETD